MDEQKRPRAWVYARIPGDYDGTMNSYKVCSMQALHDGCDIVGGSIDERGGWLLRPGYRDMMQQIKGGKVDRVYICRMRQISGKERHLYSFFKRLMQRGIQVTATEYSLRDRVNMFRLARRVERYAMGEPIGKREIFRKYPDVVDVPQLCEMLGGSRPMSKKTAYRMLNAGKIKAFRIGRSYRIPKVNVIRFLQKETPADCNTVNAAIDSVE